MTEDPTVSEPWPYTTREKQLEAEVVKWKALAERADVLVRHLPNTTWLWEQKGQWLADYSQAVKEVTE